MDKPEYIQNLESKDNFFSVMVCHELKGEFLKFLLERKLTRVYEKSSIDISLDLYEHLWSGKSRKQFKS